MSDERPIEEPTEDIPEEPSEDVPDMSLPHTIGAIRQKYKQARFRHLKAALKEGLVVKPSHCVHNRVRVAPGGRFGMCRCFTVDDENWPGVCDDEATPTMPEECGFFDYDRDKDQIKADFRDFLATSPLHEIAGRYPDLAPLIWVLGEHVPNRDEDVGDWEPGDEVRIEIFDVIVAAENADDAQQAVEHLSNMERGARGLRERAERAEAKLERAEDEADRKRAERDAIEAENKTLRTDLAKAIAEAEALRVELSRPKPEAELPAPQGGWLRTWLWNWLTRGES